MRPAKKNRPKPAALYLRASSSKQDKSVADQRAAGIEYAAANGYDVLNAFEDDGVSAFKHGRDGRPGFRALLEFCRTPAMRSGFVIVWSIDRYSRQYRAGMIELLTLEEAGVKLVDTEVGVYSSDDMGGAVTQAVRLFAAEDYSRKLSHNVTRGQQRVRSKGYKLGGTPFGFVNEQTDAGVILLEDHERADAVRTMFKRFDAGDSISAIARRLTAAGVKPIRSEVWSWASVEKILGNPLYSGQRLREKDSAPDDLIDVHADAIVERDLWRRVYDRIHERDPVRRLRSRNRDRALAGLVFCGDCGRVAHVMAVAKSRAPGHVRLRCSGAYKRTCEAGRNAVYYAWLEGALLVLWRDLVLEEGVESIARRAVDAEFAERQSEAATTAPLREEAARLDQQENALLDLALEAGETSLLAGRLRKIRERRAHLDALLTDAGAEILPYPLEMAVDAVTRTLARVSSVAVLRPLIERISIIGPAEVDVTMLGKVHRLAGERPKRPAGKGRPKKKRL